MKIKEIAHKTDKGQLRENNEDYLIVDSGNKIFIIADGMGGNIGGEVASKTAVLSMFNLLESKIKENGMLDPDENEFREFISETNKVVFEKGVHESLEGMGTTLIAGIINRGILKLIHVGDSRVYLVRDDEIRQITVDHSVVEELIQNGIITRPEARYHHLRHIITKVIGSKEIVEPDILSIPLQVGDFILFCTDGLSEMLEDEQILDCISSCNSASEACDKLIQLANYKGGKDNITLIAIKL